MPEWRVLGVVLGVSRAYKLEADPNNTCPEPIAISFVSAATSEGGNTNGYEEGGLFDRRWRSAPVGISSSEPFPVLNQSGLPSPDR